MIALHDVGTVLHLNEQVLIRSKRQAGNGQCTRSGIAIRFAIIYAVHTNLPVIFVSKRLEVRYIDDD